MFVNGAASGKYKPGISNVDRNSPPMEIGALLSTPKRRPNWVYYDITLSCQLDSGIVVHRTLPQVDRVADTLASCTITDKDIDLITGRGVNLFSNDNYTDVIQRMAHSQYWFRLYGQAMRVGEQIPIPGLKLVAGVPAIPYDVTPQLAYNKIVGNYSGLVLWHAYWDLWYTIAVAPKKQQTPPQNLAQLIDGDAKTPDGMQAPWTQPDENAVPSGPVYKSVTNITREPISGRQR